MPYDSELTRLESELLELEAEIAQAEFSIDLMTSHKVGQLSARLNATNRTINRLTGLKELKELKIKVHKERVKESGVKY